MIPVSEFEARARAFRCVERLSHRCLACGEEVAQETYFVRRDTGEPWEDPFQAGGIAMFLEHHHLFCAARPPWWLRPFSRFKGYEIVSLDPTEAAA